MNINVSIGKDKKEQIKEIIIALLCAGMASFIFLLFNSPIHPWQNKTIGTDSSVFKTVAMVMQRGGMPYRDTFDHKGPLIYLINWLGAEIAPYKGVWVFEFINLVLTITLMYKTARLLCGTWHSIITTMVSFSLLFSYFLGGNFTEEYAMSFIAVATYIFVDFFINKRISNIRLVICGFSFGGVLLLRPNMIPLWMVMCVAVLIQSLRDKKWKELRSFILWFLIGLVIIVLPFVIWLAMNDALIPCWKEYIVFNVTYSSNEVSTQIENDKWVSYFFFIKATVYINSILVLVCLRKQYNRFFNYAYLIYLLVTPYFICVSGKKYGHYGMILIPILTYPIALVFRKIEELKHSEIKGIISLVVCIYLLNSFVLSDWVDLIMQIEPAYKSRNVYHRDELVDRICQVICERTNDDEEISVYGNWDAVYVISNRGHATLYSYLFPIGYVKPSILEDYVNQLEKEQPSLIVVQGGFKDDLIMDFIDRNNYFLIWSEFDGSLDGSLIYSKY